MLKQGLDEARAAVNLDLGAVLCLQRRHVVGDVARDQRGVVPVDLFERRRSHMLAGAVEMVGDRALVVRPVRREDLVGPPAEQQLVGARLGHLLHHLVVEVVDRPPAVRESAGRVLVRAAGRLHHSVERHERVDSEVSHAI